MTSLIKFTVTYRKRSYDFEYGSQAYIFHTGIYKGLDKRFGIKVLLEYVAFVHECYLSDSNKTPLGELCDYVASHWQKIKNSDKSKYDVLEEFYDYIF